MRKPTFPIVTMIPIVRTSLCIVLHPLRGVPRTPPEYGHDASSPTSIPRSSPDARDEGLYRKSSSDPHYHQQGTSKHRRSTSPDEPVAKPCIAANSRGDKIRESRIIKKAGTITVHVYETTVSPFKSAGTLFYECQCHCWFCPFVYSCPCTAASQA
jgi:hypothetical protein